MNDNEAKESVEKTPESSSGGGTYVFLLIVFCVVIMPAFSGGIFDFGWYHAVVWLYSLPLTIILCGLSYGIHAVWSEARSDVGKIIVLLFNSILIFSISTFVTYMIFA